MLFLLLHLPYKQYRLFDSLIPELHLPLLHSKYLPAAHMARCIHWHPMKEQQGC